MWEMETDDGNVLRQYEEDGRENTWKKLDPERVVRVSLVPLVAILPQHNIFINRNAGELFIKRFARGFLKPGTGLKEYVNCIVTNRYRVWVFSDGRVLVTDKNFDNLYV